MNFRFPKRRGDFLFRGMGHFSFRGATATCRRAQLAKLLLIFHPTITLVSTSAVGLIKVWEVPEYHRSQVIAYIFIQRNLYSYVDQCPVYFSPKSSSVLTSCSFEEEWLLEISGWKSEQHVPCCSLALAVPGIVVFSRGSSFFCSRFSLFRRRPTRSHICIIQVFFLQDEPLSLGLGQCEWGITAVEIFSKKLSNPSPGIVWLHSSYWDFA